VNPEKGSLIVSWLQDSKQGNIKVLDEALKDTHHVHMWVRASQKLKVSMIFSKLQPYCKSANCQLHV